jgi:hypothetical protein
LSRNGQNSTEPSRSEKNSEEHSQIKENSRSSTEIKENSRSSLESGKSVHTIPSLNIRINNLQFRSTSQSSGEFIKWSVNPLYNNLLSHLDNGWEDLGDRITKAHCSISKSLFNLPETCIVIAFLEVCKGENCCDLTSVGSRLLDLSLQERNEFFEIYSMAETKLVNLSNESEN